MAVERFVVGGRPLSTARHTHFLAAAMMVRGGEKTV